jgi:hypothetical protein
MPFPMSHLYIAQNILNNIPVKIKDISQYYLGTLAPDAIHFRKNYDRSQKRKSHLYINLEKYDLEYFTEKWKTNVIELFLENESGKNYEFLTGYCIHIMADIYSHKNIWTPFELEFSNRKDIDYKKTYSDESLSVDLEIFQRNKYEEKLFPIINQAKGFDFLDLILKTDLCGMKNNIINIQYRNKPQINTIQNKHITYDKSVENNKRMIEYINREFIYKIMKRI